MKNTPLPSNNSYYVLCIILGLLCPGLGFTYNRQYKLALLIPTILFILIYGFCISRIIFEPLAFYFLLILLTLITALAAFGPLFFERATQPPILHTVLHSILVTSCLVGTYIYKPILLGLNLYAIPSASMTPILQINDIILADIWAFKTDTPDTNDIVLFYLKGNETTSYIKRVIGIPGDNLTVTPMLVEQFKKTSHFDSRSTYVKISLNEYFLVGDHRKQSRDSRYYGAIEKNDIYGKAIFIVLSINPEGWNFQRSGVSLLNTTYETTH